MICSVFGDRDSRGGPKLPPTHSNALCRRSPQIPGQSANTTYSSSAGDCVWPRGREMLRFLGISSSAHQQ